MPCNFNQRELAQRVKAGIRAAGGTPMEFNTISVSDGVSMGTEGMRASLISREVIADSIELVVRGHLMDGLVCLVGCDKTIPAAAMALCRLDVPGSCSTTASIAPGTLPRPRHHHPGRVRGDRRLRGRADRRRGAARSSRPPVRRRGLRRPVHGQHDVDGARVPGPVARRAERHPGAQPRQGRRGREGRRAGDAARPRRRAAVADRHPRRARERGRLGGGDRRLHQRRAAPAGDRPRAGHPVLDRRLRPDRRPYADRGQPQAGRRVRGHRHLRRRRRGAGGAGAGQARAGARGRAHGGRPHAGRDRRSGGGDAGQPVVVPIDRPIKPTGGLAILRGNLSPDGCVVKLAGHERLSHRGPARVFDSEEDASPPSRAARSRPATWS